MIQLDFEKQRDILLSASKYAVAKLAEFNCTPCDETKAHMRHAQARLFEAVKQCDPAYYGFKAKNKKEKQS